MDYLTDPKFIWDFEPTATAEVRRNCSMGFHVVQALNGVVLTNCAFCRHDPRAYYDGKWKLRFGVNSPTFRSIKLLLFGLLLSLSTQWLVWVLV